MGRDPDQRIVGDTSAEGASTGVENAEWFGSSRRNEARILLPIADIIHVLGVLLGALLVLVMRDILYEMRQWLCVPESLKDEDSRSPSASWNRRKPRSEIWE